jgi:branched-chain amino acid transport system permease protein
VLTVAVALFFDVSLTTPGTWDGLTGGVANWTGIPHPSIFGHELDTYQLYLFVFGVFLVAALLVWNVRNGKTGRVLRAVRDSEVASATLGLNVAAWKLTAFGVSAAMAGLAGALMAVTTSSVAGGSLSSYGFQYSVALVATITVFGTSSIFAAAVTGFFIVFGTWLLDLTPLSHQWFNLVLGAILIVQLLFSPEGAVVKTENDVKHLLQHLAARRRPAAVPAQSEAA